MPVLGAGGGSRADSFPRLASAGGNAGESAGDYEGSRGEGREPGGGVEREGRADSVAGESAGAGWIA